jgi:hypothetical protein
MIVDSETDQNQDEGGIWVKRWDLFEKTPLVSGSEMIVGFII